MSLLSNRTISSFPLSIGTGLAFESLFQPILPRYDPERVIPNTIDILKYNEFWINIQTLFRNLIGAIDKSLLVKIKGNDIASEVMVEMEVIDKLLQSVTATCKPIFYLCSYKEAKSSKVTLVNIRKNNTDIQRVTENRLEEFIMYFKSQKDLVFELDSDLKPSSNISALLLTHIPYDLLSYKKFKKLDLLESHTGILKPRNVWYTKYYIVPNGRMEILPFNRKLLLMLGDNVMFSPVDIRLRRQILDIAVKYKWTPMTTDFKVLSDLSSYIPEPYIARLIASI